MNKTVIVENHHEVLEAWCRLRRQLDSPPPVWTLDYHTDTMPCFRSKLPPPENGEWQDPDKVTRAIALLRHDEHFDWALRAGVISRAFIGICGENTAPPAHPAITVRRPADYPDTDTILNHPEQFRCQAERFLESDVLNDLFPQLPHPGETYILDIDCDCILCRKALFPEDDKIFRRLFDNAALVTLSRESVWVKLLKLPGETITGCEISEILSRQQP